MYVCGCQRSTLSVSCHSPVYFGGTKSFTKPGTRCFSETVYPTRSRYQPVPSHSMELELQTHIDSHDFYMSTEDLNLGTSPTEPSLHGKTIFPSFHPLFPSPLPQKKVSLDPGASCGNRYTVPDPPFKGDLTASLPSGISNNLQWSATAETRFWVKGPLLQ